MSKNQLMKEYIQKLKDYAFTKYELNDQALCVKLSEQNEDFWATFSKDCDIPLQQVSYAFKQLQEQVYQTAFNSFKLNIRYHTLKALMETGDIFRINTVTKEEISALATQIASQFTEIPAFISTQYARHMITKLSEITDSQDLIVRLTFEKKSIKEQNYPLCTEFIEEYQQFIQALIDFIQIEEEQFEGEEEETLQEGECNEVHCDGKCHGHE